MRPVTLISKVRPNVTAVSVVIMPADSYALSLIPDPDGHKDRSAGAALPDYARIVRIDNTQTTLRQRVTGLHDRPECHAVGSMGLVQQL